MIVAGMDSATAEIKRIASSKDALGCFGETICKGIFLASGIPFVCLADIENGGAPKIEMQGGGVVLPDFQTFGDCWACLLDSKAKTTSVFYRKKGQERHGINERAWLAYQKSSDIYKQHCAIAIIELWRQMDEDVPQVWSGSFLLERLKELGPPDPGFNEPTPKVYWRRKQFVDVHSFSKEELLAIYHGRMRAPSLAPTLRNIFAPVKQTALFE